MKELEEKNAIIESTMLGWEDHGIMTFYIGLDYGDEGHQHCGGYSLDDPKKDPTGKFLGRFGTSYGMQLIMQIMKTMEIGWR